MALFDGRLFLAGNEDFPDRIFYSTRISREGFSLSKESYLQVCSAGARIKALLSFGGRLWVFKSADDGDGSIISYKADDVGYAVDRVLSSVACVGEAIGYGGEIIFTAHDGLYAIEQPMKEADVKIVCRSYDIAPMLLEERLKEARLTVWRGYLALCLGEHIYLADPRGKKRYDWYYLCGIGGHKNDRTVYRYASFAEEGFEVFANPDARAEGEVISLITEDGRAIYYESRDGRKYALYPTPEMTGGELLPARLTLSDGDYLWFCSGEGDLFLFNRGRPEDTEDFYSFDRHAPRYTVSYRPDDCDIPELCKSTVGGSLLLKLKALPGSGATVKISADSGEICSYIVSAGETSFSDMDFSNFSLSQHGHCFVTLPERASGWREKQITISSDEYASPLGVCRVSYRYRIKDGS